MYVCGQATLSDVIESSAQQSEALAKAASQA